jgi:hypothetical protein
LTKRRPGSDFLSSEGDKRFPELYIRKREERTGEEASGRAKRLTNHICWLVSNVEGW